MVLLAILLPVALAVASYCINFVFMEMTRTELQIATDVATRASGRALAITGDKKKAIDKAQELLSLNPVANQAVPFSSSDIEFGVSTRLTEKERYQFGSGPNPNALRLNSNATFQPPMLFPTMGIPINFRPFKAAISTQIELDVALVLDRSGSMAFADNEASGFSPPAAAPAGWKFGDPVPPKSRWLDTVTAVSALMDLFRTSSHDERISLSTYSSSAKDDLKLTNDYASIEKEMDDYSKKFKGGATNVGDGIIKGAKTLADKKTARKWATRIMIVMSDGRHNTGSDPIVAAQTVADADITIYTVSFSQEADITLMQTIASIGSGKHFHAVTGSQLAQAFEDIARSLPTLVTY